MGKSRFGYRYNNDYKTTTFRDFDNIIIKGGKIILENEGKFIMYEFAENKTATVSIKGSSVFVDDCRQVSGSFDPMDTILANEIVWLGR